MVARELLNYLLSDLRRGRKGEMVGNGAGGVQSALAPGLAGQDGRPPPRRGRSASRRARARTYIYI